MFTDDRLFTERGLAHLHDAVLDGCELSVPGERLRTLFDLLPQEVQDGARRWGLSDTLVRDAICVWAMANAQVVADHVK